jgi:hypothetical protein
MSRHIFDKCVTVSMKHFVVDSNKVFVCHSISTSPPLQLEGDRGRNKIHAINLLRLRKDFVDSRDRFRLQFSHASTIAPCSARAREKEKKVRQAEKNNSCIDLDLARLLSQQYSCQESCKVGGTPSPRHETLLYHVPSGAVKRKKIFISIPRSRLAWFPLSRPQGNDEKNLEKNRKISCRIPAHLVDCPPSVNHNTLQKEKHYGSST